MAFCTMSNFDDTTQIEFILFVLCFVKDNPGKKGHCHCRGQFGKKNSYVVIYIGRVFFAKKPATVAVAFLIRATFIDITQIGFILFLLHHSKYL